MPQKVWRFVWPRRVAPEGLRSGACGAMDRVVGWERIIDHVLHGVGVQTPHRHLNAIMARPEASE